MSLEMSILLPLLLKLDELARSADDGARYENDMPYLCCPCTVVSDGCHSTVVLVFWRHGPLVDCCQIRALQVQAETDSTDRQLSVAAHLALVTGVADCLGA